MAMEIIVQPDARTAARKVAELIGQSLAAQPGLVLGLASGRTMEPVYEELIRMHRQDGLDFSRCRTFNLDEYIGLAADDPRSFHYFMRRHFFDHVNIVSSHAHLPDGMASDLEAECRHYEKLIAANGGIAFQLLGIGLNGHIGFNEPESPLDSRTRVQELSPLTRAQNASSFPSLEEVPQQAITMGIGTILEARRCVLLATGLGKAKIVAKAIEGPLTTTVAATALQLHPNCTVVLDEAAASALKNKIVARE